MDILFLTETWLNPESDQVAIGELTLPGYSFINVPRKTSNHGGIGVLYRDSLKLCVIPFDYSCETFEYVIISDKSRKVYYVVVYRPPPSRENGLKASKYLSDIEEFLLQLSSLSGKMVLLGDFNVHADIPSKLGHQALS